MELPLNYWLETIADDKIRESALEQWDKYDKVATSTAHAIGSFADWEKTNEKRKHWADIHDRAVAGYFLLREVTIEGLRFNPETRGWVREYFEKPSTPQPEQPSVTKQILLALAEAEEHAGNNKFISSELRIYAQSKSAKLREIAEKL